MQLFDARSCLRRAAVCCTQELVGPSNIEDVAAAAQDSNTTIGVHVYLFLHYGDPWGWEFEAATELEVGRPARGYCEQPQSTRQMHVPPESQCNEDGGRNVAAAVDVATVSWGRQISSRPAQPSLANSLPRVGDFIKPVSPAGPGDLARARPGAEGLHGAHQWL